MNIVRRAWRVLREQGLGTFTRRIVGRVFHLGTKPPSLVRYEDARDVDWSRPHPSIAAATSGAEGPFTVAWIMSPPGLNSGGHQNIFRFIHFMEQAGHRCKVYLYSTEQEYSPGQVRTMIDESTSYPQVLATIEDYPAGGVSADVDAVFATGWETAYPSYNDPSLARRFYFVQDFEPFFYPIGSDSVLAENTYRFGFHGLTAGRWLEGKLRDEYGMSTNAFDFASDSDHYSLLNRGRRNEVFFYARPATERRGFELGIMALDLFAAARPDAIINLVGEDVAHLRVPFTHTNLRGLGVGDLNAVYNRCAVGLVLSFTNMSLLPLELLGSGVIPVVNDGPNNRAVSSNPYIAYAASSPRALADRLIELYDRADLPHYAEEASMSVAMTNWADSGAQFLAAFEGSMRG